MTATEGAITLENPTKYANQRKSEENTSPPTDRPHPRRLGWFGTACIAMGGSNQSLFLMSALLIGQGDIPGQGSMAILLLVIGLLVSYMQIPGWIELTLLFPNRVGGIAATCAEAFKPYSEVLANLTGVCYWWGWIPTCGISALISAAAINQWYLPHTSVPLLATLIVLLFTFINLRGIHFASMVAVPIALISASLALISGLVPIFTHQVDWSRAVDFHLTVPFSGYFGQLTSFMAGLYLIGFAAPAFEQAACHVGEQINPHTNQPRAIYASAVMAAVYFVLLPIVWLGVLGPESLSKDLANVLGPTFAPIFGAFAKAAAIWFVMFNLFHDTLAPLAGATRTLAQLSEDGLLPRLFAQRSPTDAPAFATVFTAIIAIFFLWMGDPLWLIAAANFTYLIGICLPNIAVWLLRKDQPLMERPYRAPKGTIMLGMLAVSIWCLSTLLGFEQFGLPTVIVAVLFAYSGSILYAWRKASDRWRQGLPAIAHTLHIKLTGAMVMVLLLDGIGYLIAVYHVPSHHNVLITLLSDIFVMVAILTISVGLVLPGMIAHSVNQVANAARRLATGTMTDFSRAMQALGRGDLDAAYARINVSPVIVHSKDEIGDMAEDFNLLQDEIVRSVKGLDSARVGLTEARADLIEANLFLHENEKELKELNETLEQRVIARTQELEKLQQQLINAAHQSGMAEVATNVLHNVGNVLNSINVSGNLIFEKISRSKLEKLSKINERVGEHTNDFVNYITNDPNGIHFPEYLNNLTVFLREEQGEILQELKDLLFNIQHVKDIVSTQQTLAGVAGLEQLVNIQEVVIDALKMTGKSNFIIEEQFENLKPVLIDKIKLTQILINIIRNAKDALIESTHMEKKLILKIYLNSHNRFRIEIIDNGIGILPENIQKIFSHGFTTKVKGHGFGLHASALAAKEMKGSLEAYSAGKNQGAQFILELPYKLL